MSLDLWNVIKESRENAKYIASQKQYENLYNIFSKLSKRDIQSLREIWSSYLEKMIANPEFELLHLEDGGIVDGGDDTFYMDFSNWVIAQGKELYNDFMANGHKVIIEYIEKNNISDEEYTYECMAYAFHDFMDNEENENENNDVNDKDVIKELSDTEIKKIYEQCNTFNKSFGVEQNLYLLEVYNKLFNTTLGFLHFHMVQEILDTIIVEMARRFFENKSK